MSTDNAGGVMYSNSDPSIPNAAPYTSLFGTSTFPGFSPHPTAPHSKKGNKDKARRVSRDGFPLVNGASEGKIALHRTSVANWAPSGIAAMAASADGSLLAVARDSGMIEIWETRHFNNIKVIEGYDRASVSSIVLIQESGPLGVRLFTSGLDGYICEWDLEEGKVKERQASYGGAVWQLACGPRTRDGKEQLLAAACDDGGIRIFSVVQGGGCVFKGTLNCEGGRALCVAWDEKKTNLVSGHSDACLRVWEGEMKENGRFSGHEKVKMTLENTDSKVKRAKRSARNDRSSNLPEDRESSICVWSVLYLNNGTVVAGDSVGRVTFWDSRFGTKICDFVKHEADVMSLTCTRDRKNVFASGVDVKVALFSNVKATGGGDKWVYVHAKRPHTHDVRCMTVIRTLPKGKQKGCDCLITGSQDSRVLRFTSTIGGLPNAFMKTAPSRMSYAPDPPDIQIVSVETGEAAGPRVMLAAHQKKVDLWQLLDDPVEDIQDREELDELATNVKPRYLAQIQMGGGHHISCACLSRDGQHLALSSSKRMKVLKLDGLSRLPCLTSAQLLLNEAPDISVQNQKMEGLRPACCMTFSANSRELFTGHTDHHISVFDLTTLSLKSTFKLAAPPFCQSPSLIDLIPKTMSRLVSSGNGKWLAGVKDCQITLFNMETGAFHGTLSVPARVALAQFDPSSNFLVVGTVAKSIFTVFDVGRLVATQWSERNSVIGKMSETIGQPRDGTFRTGEGDSMVVWSNKSFCHIKFSEPIPHKEKRVAQPKSNQSDPPGENVRLIHMSDTGVLLHFDFFGQDSAIVVEKDWEDVANALPPPIWRKRYGIS